MRRLVFLTGLWVALGALYAPASAQPAGGAAPNWCVSWFDGCNSCIRSVRGNVICTKKACAKRKPFRCFQRIVMPAGCQTYFDGCTTCQRVRGMVRCAVRTCKTRREARCLVSSGKRPADCRRYYDGCNTCIRQDNGAWRCTLRACTRHGTPRCLDKKG